MATYRETKMNITEDFFCRNNTSEKIVQQQLKVLGKKLSTQILHPVEFFSERKAKCFFKQTKVERIHNWENFKKG